MHIVSIMAHQDDEMRCLGTMLKCRERGDALAFITVTDGSLGFVQNPSIAREEAAAIRHAEMSSLCTAIGADFVNMGEPDEFLYDTPKVRLALIEAIRRTHADVIFTHYHEDYNADHVTVNALVRHCAMQAALPVIETASAPLAASPAVFLVEPLGPFTFPATHFVDISAYHAQKVSLLKHHASQDEALFLALGAGFERLCTRLEAYRGEQVGCEYAEAFTPMQARGAVKGYSVLP